MAVLGLLVVLTACSRSTVSSTDYSSAFKLRDLQDGPSLLRVAPRIEVRAFEKPYRSLFPDSTAVFARLTRALLDSLSLKTFTVKAEPQGREDWNRLFDSTGAKYRIRVTSVVIFDTILPVHQVLAPRGTAFMEPIGSSPGRACRVDLRVEIDNAAADSLYGFTVHTRTEVPLHNDPKALESALDAAAREASRHLQGPAPTFSGLRLPLRNR